jgi:hypothetical protein
MTGTALVPKSLQAGTVSRLAKKRWVDSRHNVSAEAFDLRDRTPPETYVSFFMCEGSTNEEWQHSAVRCLEERKMGKRNGLMFLLDVEEAIEEVNDGSAIIEFVPKGLPHCGLVYQAQDQALIQEAKAVLCLLAKVFAIQPYLTLQITQA